MCLCNGFNVNMLYSIWRLFRRVQLSCLGVASALWGTPGISRPLDGNFRAKLGYCKLYHPFRPLPSLPYISSTLFSSLLPSHLSSAHSLSHYRLSPISLCSPSCHLSERMWHGMIKQLADVLMPLRKEAKSELAIVFVVYECKTGCRLKV